MPAGEAFGPEHRRRLDRSVALAATQSGVSFSVYVGAVEGGDARRTAIRLLRSVTADVGSPAVLIFVAPAERQLEIVTTPVARRRLSDQACGLAALSMTTSFGVGDLVGGLVNGLRMLADAAGRPAGVPGLTSADGATVTGLGS